MAWIRVPEGWYDPVTNTLSTTEPGYNPAQYAPDQLAKQLADYLGGRVEQTEVAGPIKPPPQNLINVEGVQLNAGLLAERYANYPRELADRMTQDELRLAGVSWNPPANKQPPVVSFAPSIPDAQIPAQTTIDPGAVPSVTPRPTTPVSGTGVSVTGTADVGEAVNLPAPIRHHEPAYTPATLRERILARAGGDNFYTWDEWNWFYEQVTGEPGPAPEDRGLTRSSDGLVYIDGSSRFNYATWERYALGKREPSEPEPVEPKKRSILSVLLDMIAWILKVVIGGSKHAKISGEKPQ